MKKVKFCWSKKLCYVFCLSLIIGGMLTGCKAAESNKNSEVQADNNISYNADIKDSDGLIPDKNSTEDKGTDTDNKQENNDSSVPVAYPAVEPYEVKVTLDPSFDYANCSKINSGEAVLYHNKGSEKGNYVICVNAGHGTSGGSAYKTLSHPDGSPKVSGGTNALGAVESTAISSGTVFLDGTPEASVTLEQALILKDLLYEAGYSVLMIRETDDVQLDNVARTVIANNYADCHIALHWDSTEAALGAFYISTPDVASYKAMEPVASTWQKSEELGKCLIKGLSKETKVKGEGCIPIDLTQTSYSTIPSIDLELGDRASDHSRSALEANARGIVRGVNEFFGF